MRAGLTFGKAIAGIMAQAKGRSIGTLSSPIYAGKQMHAFPRACSGGPGPLAGALLTHGRTACVAAMHSSLHSFY